VLGTDAATASLLDQAHVRARFDAHVSGAEENSYLLWSVWVLERWLRTQGGQSSHP
jgi:hypothetical protein